MPAAGEVYWVPKELSVAGDPKDRRHVLGHACEATDDEFSTVFYASTQRTQQSYGARHLVVPPRPQVTLDGTPANGFRETTYVYPGVPTPVPATALTNRAGALNQAELATLRGLLPDAIGVGTGTCWSAPMYLQHSGFLYAGGRRAQSLRGTVVTFAREVLDRLRGTDADEAIEFGIVASRHEISAHPEAYQAIVPVVPDVDAANTDELEVTGESWIGDLTGDADRALILIRGAFYLHPSALRRTRLERVVQTATMQRIEQALLARWTS